MAFGIGDSSNTSTEKYYNGDFFEPTIELSLRISIKLSQIQNKIQINNKMIST